MWVKTYIIISNTTITNFNKNCYCKPKNFEEYENFLLRKKNYKVTDTNHIKFAKKIIYFIENFKSFGGDMKVKQTYANDSKKILRGILYNIRKFKKKFKFFYVFRITFSSRR